jgi:hypothetical protein
MTQTWTRDEVEYKNPFDGTKTRRCRGYYYQATLAYDAASYDLLASFRDLLNINSTDLQFYPSTDSDEHYSVDMNDELEHEDAHVAEAVKGFSLVFRGNTRFESPLNYPVQYWGSRDTLFSSIADNTFVDFK